MYDYWLHQQIYQVIHKTRQTVFSYSLRNVEERVDSVL
jgi:hypothetical protein